MYIRFKLGNLIATIDNLSGMCSRLSAGVDLVLIKTEVDEVYSI